MARDVLLFDPGKSIVTSLDKSYQSARVNPEV